MILIIDIGNTNFKCSVYKKDKQLVIEDQIKTKEVNEKFLTVLVKNKQINNCYIGSVVPSINHKVEKLVKKVLKITPKFLTPKDFIHEFDLSRFDLNEIGVDIIGFALYLKNTYKQTIGICYGTVLFAIGVIKNKLLGVILVPYVERGIRKTVEKTEMIKFEHIDYDPLYFEFGSNTHDALLSGINHVYEGLTTNICSYFQKKHGFNKLCITGGNLIKIHLNDDYKNKFDIHQVHNAVIKGYLELVTKK